MVSPSSTPSVHFGERVASRHIIAMAPIKQRLIVLAVCLVLTLVNAHNIQLKAHSRECFHELLHADDKMTVSFQVGDREFGGSGNLDIDFWVGSLMLQSIYVVALY